MGSSDIRNKDLEAETVLVTGANGFVGLNLVQQLALRSVQVLAASRRPPDSLGAVPEDAKVDWVLCDVTDRDALIDLVRNRSVTRIVHAAAVTPSQHIEQNDPTRVVDVNFGGTLNALEAARIGRVKRFLFVSSSVLYRGCQIDHGPAREEEALPPSNLYGLCKDASEGLCQQYQALCNISAISARLGTAFGPWERASHSRTRLSAIAQLVTWALEKPNQPLQTQGLQVVRDYIYVVDACAALAELALLSKPRWNIYNLSSDVAYPLNEVLRAIQAYIPGFRWHDSVGSEQADFYFTATDTRVPLDMSRLRSDLPQLQFRGLSTCIAEYITWLQEIKA